MWSNDDINYLKNNYLIKTTNELSLYFKRSKQSIINKANTLNVDKKYKKYNYPNINLFTSLDKKEICYIMGYLWSDGNLSNSALKLECIYDDLKDVEHIFDSIGEWYKYTRQRKGYKKGFIFGIYNKEYCELFESYNFLNKSKESPNFLNKMSDDNLRYFFRGVLDGDGCIYVNNKNNQYQLTFCGSYEQNWDYVETYLKNISIKYTIKNKIQTTGKYSIVYVHKNDAIKYLNYLYNGYDEDKIGLNRKYQKYQEIKNFEIKD